MRSSSLLYWAVVVNLASKPYKTYWVSACTTYRIFHFNIVFLVDIIHDIESKFLVNIVYDIDYDILHDIVLDILCGSIPVQLRIGGFSGFPVHSTNPLGSTGVENPYSQLNELGQP